MKIKTLREQWTSDSRFVVYASPWTNRRATVHVRREDDPTITLCGREIVPVTLDGWFPGDDFGDPCRKCEAIAKKGGA